MRASSVAFSTVEQGGAVALLFAKLVSLMLDATLLSGDCDRFRSLTSGMGAIVVAR